MHANLGSVSPRVQDKPANKTSAAAVGRPKRKRKSQKGTPAARPGLFESPEEAAGAPAKAPPPGPALTAAWARGLVRAEDEFLLYARPRAATPGARISKALEEGARRQQGLDLLDERRPLPLFRSPAYESFRAAVKKAGGEGEKTTPIAGLRGKKKEPRGREGPEAVCPSAGSGRAGMPHTRGARSLARPAALSEAPRSSFASKSPSAAREASSLALSESEVGLFAIGEDAGAPLDPLFCLLGEEHYERLVLRELELGERRRLEPPGPAPWAFSHGGGADDPDEVASLLRNSLSRPSTPREGGGRKASPASSPPGTRLSTSVEVPEASTPRGDGPHPAELPVKPDESPPPKRHVEPRAGEQTRTAGAPLGDGGGSRSPGGSPADPNAAVSPPSSPSRPSTTTTSTRLRPWARGREGSPPESIALPRRASASSKSPQPSPEEEELVREKEAEENGKADAAPPILEEIRPLPMDLPPPPPHEGDVVAEKPLPAESTPPPRDPATAELFDFIAVYARRLRRDRGAPQPGPSPPSTNRKSPPRLNAKFIRELRRRIGLSEVFSSSSSSSLSIQFNDEADEEEEGGEVVEKKEEKSPAKKGKVKSPSFPQEENSSNGLDDGSYHNHNVQYVLDLFGRMWREDGGFGVAFPALPDALFPERRDDAGLSTLLCNRDLVLFEEGQAAGMRNWGSAKLDTMAGEKQTQVESYMKALELSFAS